MLEQWNSGGIIRQPIRLLKSIQLLFPMFLVRLFLAQLIFYQILAHALTQFLQTNKTCGPDSSLHPNCHHQIVFVTLNLKIEYPPSYKRFIWDYKNANKQLISHAIQNFNLEKSFEDKNVHDQVYLFKSKHFIILYPIKLSHAMTKIHHGLMMKLGKFWMRKMSYLNSLLIMGNY